MRPPSMITITDHPDETIFTNLRENVARNSDAVAPGCRLFCIPYVWADLPDQVLCVPLDVRRSLARQS